MSDIPSTDDVRETFAEAFNGPARDAALVEFDRWLAGERNAAAAYALRKVVWDWRADPDAFGDNDKDYRNALLYIADLVEAG